jgi:hypothetical protein
MSLIPLAAHLIRLAATDMEYAQDLRDAVLADDQAVSGLVEADVQQDDLAELTSSQWQWYASWRQELNGGLDRVVLDHLTATAVTRFARFEVRELVLRDPETIELAPQVHDVSNWPDAIGLNWLSEQARGARIIEARERGELGVSEASELMRDEALELMDDALQCATQASWFLLRQLTALNEWRDRVRHDLEVFADGRELNIQIRRSWGLGEPLGR